MGYGRGINTLAQSMIHTILTLNYVAVGTIALAGFMLGWLWYSPLLFARAWMREMKLTPEKMREIPARGVAKYFGTAFGYMLFSTFGLAVLIRCQGVTHWLSGTGYGLFVGGFVLGVRLLNSSMWEQRSWRLQAITIGHEIALFTLQGALLAVWN